MTDTTFSLNVRNMPGMPLQIETTNSMISNLAQPSRASRRLAATNRPIGTGAHHVEGADLNERRAHSLRHLMVTCVTRQNAALTTVAMR